MKNILQFLTVFCFLVMTVLTAVPAYASLAGQSAADKFGPEAVWDPFHETGGAEVRECYYSAGDTLDCVIEAMEEAGAPTQAVEFVKRTEGEAFLVDFSEQGPADLGGMVYPGRANGNFQSVLLNGSPPLVLTDELPPATQRAVETHAAYQRVERDNPGLMLWTWSGRREGVQTLPLGWQRFLFSYPLKTCNACDVLGTAFVAFDFSETGEFLGTKILFVTEDYESGKNRLQESVSVDSNEELIAYFVEDVRWHEHSGDFLGSSIWYVHPDGSGQQKVISLAEPIWNLTWSPNGKYLVYTVTGTSYTHVVLDLQGNVLYRITGAVADFDWSPQGDRLAYFNVNTDDPENWISTMFILEIRTGKTLQVTSSATLKKHVEWSPDGEQLAFTTREGVLITHPESGTEEWLAEIPDGAFILWEDEGIFFSEYEEEFILKVISVSSGEITRLVPISGGLGAWTQVYSPLRHSFCDACRDSTGLCAVQVDKQKPEVTVIAKGLDSGYCTWSPDGKQILYGTGSFRDEDIALHVMDASSGDSRKIAPGAGGKWRPIPSGINLDIADLISAKEKTIPLLEKTSVDIVGLPIPVNAFDETSARELLESLEQKAQADSLKAEQLEALQRVTLQEEALAELLPKYGQASTDLTEAFTDVLGLLIVFNDRAGEILEKAANSSHRYTRAWKHLQRMIDRKILNVIDSLVKVMIRIGPDTEIQQDMGAFWDLLLTGIRTNADTKEALKDIILGKVVKQPGVSFWVRVYVKSLQPSIDQGIRSAELDYGGAEPIWEMEGDAERAEIHMNSLVKQAQIEADHAHELHEAFMEGVDRAQLIADISELGTLTPAAAAAKIGAIVSNITNAAIDALSMRQAWKSMDCIKYLSSRAGSLAFDPNQPGESCRDRGSWLQFSDMHLASQSLRKGDIAAWNTLLVQLDAQTQSYEEAIAESISALESGDPESVEQALEKLEQTDRDLSNKIGNATALALSQDGNAVDRIATQAMRFSSEALNFYLLTSAYLLPEEDTPVSIAEIESAADRTIGSLEQFNQSFENMSPVVEEKSPLPLIDDITVNAVGDKNTIEAQVIVANKGSATAQDVSIQTLCDGHQADTIEIDSLKPDQQFEIEFECPAGSSILRAQIQSEGHITDTRVEFINTSLAVEESRNLWQRILSALPWVCGGVMGLIVIVFFLGLWLSKRR